MTTMKSRPHILVVPYPAVGHMLPLFNLTHKLALHGVKITILISPKNLSLVSPLPSNIQTLILPFPTHPEIPTGVENMQELPISYIPQIISALQKLYDPVLEWFHDLPHDPPVAILSDIFQSRWTCRLCDHLGLKRIGFTPTNAHFLCSFWSATERLPQSPEIGEVHVANISSWGYILNSFDDLEPETLEMLKVNFFKHGRVWAAGPLLNERSSVATPTDHKSIEWLDSCKVNGSVLYVGFGTQITLSSEQMEAVAHALENSGVKFVWSVKPPMKGVAGVQNVIPEGFEERVVERGMIIKDWAPQARILEHRAVGAYLTHCGWNSVMEGLCAGVVLLGWPMQADHHINAKLMIDELGVGVRVCDGLESVPDSVELAKILAGSVSLSGSVRARVMEIRNSALKAIEENGTSSKALDNMLHELSKLQK